VAVGVVSKNCSYDNKSRWKPEWVLLPAFDSVYSGFAWGMGIDRVAILKFGVED